MAAPSRTRARETRVSFPTPNGTADGVLHAPRSSRGKKPPLVVMLHGLLGTAEARHRLTLARALAGEGYAVLRFTFPTGSKRDQDPAGFYEKHLAASRAALDFATSLKGVDASRVALVGHCTGANLAFDVAAGEPKRVKAVVGLAGWSRASLFTPARAVPVLDVAQSKEDRHAFHANVQAALQEDLAAPLDRLKAPVLFLHARRDTIVPHEAADELFRRKRRGERVLAWLDDDHFFSGDANALARSVARWLRTVLPAGDA